jgi:hypothetical protein
MSEPAKSCCAAAISAALRPLRLHSCCRQNDIDIGYDDDMLFSLSLLLHDRAEIHLLFFGPIE